MPQYVSRAGLKLEHALDAFSIDVRHLTCADLGCNVGGFVDCLLQRGAARVYAIDTGYGALDYNLRRDGRVIVMERTNAMHAEIPEPAAFISIDVAWTKQRHILPAARRMIAPGGRVVTLIKPHYEAETGLPRGGILPAEHLPKVLEIVWSEVQAAGFDIVCHSPSPIKGSGGNTEYLALLAAR